MLHETLSFAVRGSPRYNAVAFWPAPLLVALQARVVELMAAGHHRAVAFRKAVRELDPTRRSA